MLLQLFSYPLEVYVAGHVVLTTVQVGAVIVPKVGGVPALHVKVAEPVPTLHLTVQALPTARPLGQSTEYLRGEKVESGRGMMSRVPYFTVRRQA